MNLFSWLKSNDQNKETESSDRGADRKMFDKLGRPIREPWIGQQFNPKEDGLFIVGESHYWEQSDRDNPEMTNIVLESVVNGQRFAFFTKIESAIRGVESTRVVPGDFWPRHAFANFCQGAFPLAGRKPPGMKKEMFDRGIETFPSILQKVKPKRMLVFSTEVWNNFDKFQTIRWYSKDPIVHNGKKIDNGYLTDVDEGFHVYCTWLPHPNARNWGASTGWTPFIQEFLNRDLDPYPYDAQCR